jgi:hypothetical protein
VPRQTAARCNGAGRSKTTRQARNPRPPEKVQALRRGDQGRSVPTTVVGAPQPAALGWRRSLLRRPTQRSTCNGDRLRSLPAGGPASGNVSTWFTADDPELARARTAVGTHSRGTWIDFRLIFNSVAGSNPPEALRRGGSGAVQVPTSRRPAGRVWDGRRSLLQRPASGSALNMWKRFQMPAHGGKGLRVVWGRFSDCFFIGV